MGRPSAWTSTAHSRWALPRLAVLQRYRRGGASRGLSPVNLPQGRLVIGWTMGVALAESRDAVSTVPGHIVVAAACTTFILAMNRPHGRVMHEVAPPEANTFNSDLHRLYQRIVPTRALLRVQCQDGESVRPSRVLIVRKT